MGSIPALNPPKAFLLSIPNGMTDLSYTVPSIPAFNMIEILDQT
jgi:hypothetical protein